MVPFRIPDRYHYENKRYDGGQGFVSLYKDTFLDRFVAIKYMKSVADANLLKKELSALRDLRSRHVVEVYDLLFAKRSDAAALVQEFVPGPSLPDYIAAKPMDHEVLKTLWQLASGLADIHAKQKVHRDIKPSNLKFDGENILKILDFGIVSELPQDDETVNARGTRHYAAPELYGKRPIKVTPSLDVYAFGVTSWYLLNHGSLPKALREDPPQSDSRPPSFSTAMITLATELVPMFDATLAVCPDTRPRMAEVRDALQRRLLYGKHVLTLSAGGGKTVLNTPARGVTVKAGSATLLIRYTGLQFVIEQLQGEVFINNAPAAVGQSIPGSCVITVNTSPFGYNRTFISANVSNPGVVL
jgi:serine/threonine protein kinase